MNDFRKQFAITANKAYLNSCSYGALADSVAAGLQQYLTDRVEKGACWEEWLGMLQHLRVSTAKLLNANADEVAITTSLTAGLNSLVSSLDFNGERNKIICTEFDFPTTAQIWHAQKVCGAQVHSVDIENSDDAEALIREALDDSVYVLSIPLICYRNGRRLRPEKIIPAAKKLGVKIILDAYQGVGSMPVDVQQWDADVVLGGYLKYLLGTAGLAYMYIKQDWLDQLTPTTSGWFAQADVNAMSIADNEPSNSARKFEAGTPNVSALYACIAGLELIHQASPAVIEKHIGELNQSVKQHVQQQGWQIASGDLAHGPMIALRCKEMYKLVGILAQQGVVVSCRDNNIRISPHLYNNQQDIEKLLSVLDDNRTYLEGLSI